MLTRIIQWFREWNCFAKLHKSGWREKKIRRQKYFTWLKKYIYTTFPLAHLCIFTYKVLPLVVTKEGSKKYELQSPFCHLLALGGRAYSTEKSGHSTCNISICCSPRNHVIILEGIMFANANQCPNTKYQPHLGFLCSHFSDGCAMTQQSSPGVESR